MSTLRSLSMQLRGTGLVIPFLVLQAQCQIPKSIGIMIFPRLVELDAAGPRSLLDIVAFQGGLNVSFVAETKDLVPTHVANSVAFIPTYTFDEDPELDVLLIPGGPGSRVAYNNSVVINYVKRTYPKLQYIMSVCTGAQVLAKAGVLDGKNATTNKFSWKEMVASGPTVNWIAKARWVVDGNVWTSSGVTAGMDMTHDFISTILQNATLADRAAAIIEYEPHRNASWDPFADVWGAEDVPPQV